MGHECPEGEYMYSSTLSLTLVLGGDEWSMPAPGHFTPNKDPVPIVQEDRWAPGLVSMGAENLTSNRIKFLYRPACSESLHKLRHPSSYCCYKNIHKLQFRCCFRSPFLSNQTMAVEGLNSNEGHTITQNLPHKILCMTLSWGSMWLCGI
jgi:hypothetical protein